MKNWTKSLRNTANKGLTVRLTPTEFKIAAKLVHKDKFLQCVAERAVSLMLNVPRNGKMYDQDVPDLGSFIDVLVKERNDETAWVREDWQYKTNKRAVVFVKADLLERVFATSEWVWSHQVKKREIWTLFYEIEKNGDKREINRLNGKWAKDLDQDLKNGLGVVESKLTP